MRGVSGAECGVGGVRGLHSTPFIPFRCDTESSLSFVKTLNWENCQEKKERNCVFPFFFAFIFIPKILIERVGMGYLCDRQDTGGGAADTIYNFLIIYGSEIFYLFIDH